MHGHVLPSSIYQGQYVFLKCIDIVLKVFETHTLIFRGGCYSVGEAGWLVIGKLLAHIPASLGWAELHVKVSLSKILNPKFAPDVQLAMPLVRAFTNGRGIRTITSFPGCTLAFVQSANWNFAWSQLSCPISCTNHASLSCFKSGGFLFLYGKMYQTPPSSLHIACNYAARSCSPDLILKQAERWPHISQEQTEPQTTDLAKRNRLLKCHHSTPCGPDECFCCINFATWACRTIICFQNLTLLFFLSNYSLFCAFLTRFVI